MLPSSRIRILSLRPLRPPSAPRPRLFTVNVARQTLLHQQRHRPQLPYLSQPVSSPPQFRLISTETRTFVREQLFLATKWTAILWTFLFLGGLTYYGVTTELSERRNPTPPEWGFWTRKALRAARFFSDEELLETMGFIDWARTGGKYRSALGRLEDPTGDGKGVEIIDGVGADVESKSEAWRTGYCEVLMGCARAAEHLDQMVLDTTRSIVFPKEVVIGPGNPDPRPTPPYMKSAPREEDCKKAFQAPELFYTRILAGKGFSRKERIEAAVAWGNWLTFTGAEESAEETYRWAVDIAKEAANDDLVDPKTNVLDVGKGEVTENLLVASTALAVHHARKGNVDAALPIFLSVLRARRSAPVATPPAEDVEEKRDPKGLALLRTLVTPPTFPAPPPSGDTPYIRSSPGESCDESELMLYIGEILFATSAAKEVGVSWTRKAVNIADEKLRVLPTTEEAQRKKCRECLLTGVGNWDIMLKRLEAEVHDKTVENKGWFGGWWATGREGAEAKDEIEMGAKLLGPLRERIVQEGIAGSVSRRGGGSGGVWIG
ncbi:uncharacterized protein RCC_01161 [Ramularia collo-cygni]|uniref:MFS maltose permease n=1 Tax=Ramularia collo-cygni TaxID=112498 RepID=A0A2D3UTU3_9PEZI|nr:uncharacterized protein RCC_01161 [Ramularia collo-cygni]CZT15297.1 uncharacterized protein RCC_01161 [Ramularia collo-cygni]